MFYGGISVHHLGVLRDIFLVTVDLILHVDGGCSGSQNRRGAWVIWRYPLLSIQGFPVIWIHSEGEKAIFPVREFGWHVGDIVLEQLMCVVDVCKIWFTV